MGSESRKQGEEFKRVRVAILGLVIAKADGLFAEKSVEGYVTGKQILRPVCIGVFRWN
jgi:hypothetical protein